MTYLLTKLNPDGTGEAVRPEYNSRLDPFEDFSNHIASLPTYPVAASGLAVGDWFDADVEVLLSYGQGSAWYKMKNLDLSNFGTDFLNNAEKRLLPKVQSGEEKREETFEQYMSNSRDEFVRKVNSNVWATDLRVAAEDILICFDQMRERLSSPSSTEAVEFAEWVSDNYQSDYDGTWRTYIDSRAKIFNTRYTTAELYNIFITTK